MKRTHLPADAQAQRISDFRIEALSQGAPIPRASQPWPGIEGAIYAGLVPGFLNEPDYHLVILRDQPVQQRLSWKAWIDWARALGADLPTRNESAFLYAFHRERFEGVWYWTSTQSSSSGAWYQYFYHGRQGTSCKSSEGWGCAVRRFSSSVLQSVEGTQAAEAA